MSLGGLFFILTKHTVGGLPMDIGFSLYGVLILLWATLTYKNARDQEFDSHRRWALRLFALGISSWLYRVEYSLWALLNGGLVGHNFDTWDGPLDYVMDFFFYIPTLLVCEFYIRRPAFAHKLFILLAPALAIGCLIALFQWWLPMF
ncbi:DUF2306 domain-containing protein [Moorena producens JHB]|uniref:DUF2306 domain-containing protein n=1 Tax=Moorena producens (strain JHB) TaxID=1454205 RepID=A0A1D9FXM5_MOOP1|nr:DUF2306 domain-containing protein [Moorena producens]AOY80091.1 DUF2306 domain-containing protein [Moorena producens JHB]